MSNHLDNLPDFLTLYTKDSLNPSPTSLTFDWILPNSYYSNQRASSCYVSIVDSFCENVTDNTLFSQDAYLITLGGGATNYHSTHNQGIVLGGIVKKGWISALVPPSTESNTYEFMKTGAMLQPLIAARPQNINLALADLNGAVLARPSNPPFDWVVTLRFDYVNQDKQIEGMLDTYTNNLLH